MAEPERFEVVISGIGGKFPDSDHIAQLKEKLFNKTDLITVDDRRWTPGEDGAPLGAGKIYEIEKFDQTFFGIHRNLCHSMDAMIRHLMERSFEAVIDSGNCPKSLAGRNIGVYTASTISESENLSVYQGLLSGFGLLGHNRGMLANRISYSLNLNGPSCSMDATWLGGFEVLRLAAERIAAGLMEGCIVGVANLQVFPMLSLEFQNFGVLCPDGKCRSFDAEANGYPRSEAIVAFFLQRKIDAKRNYGTILSVNTPNFGERNTDYIYHDGKLLTGFLEKFYKECDIDPSSVAYLEADGCALKRTESTELNSLSQVMCTKNRKSPLLIGSVKSNLGHTESASAFVSIAKAVIVMDSGAIPANLHYNTPNPQVPALCNGKLKVVSDTENLPGDLVAVNGYSFSGGMGHVLMRQNPKIKKQVCKDGNLPEDGLPRIVLASSRHAEGATKILNSLKSMPLDVEHVALMNNVAKENITGHMYRMYQILPVTNEVSSDMKEYDGDEKVVWYIFSGMGSQWNGMGAGLMQFPVFAAAIDRCDKVLAPLGVDIKNVLTSMDQFVFSNILNCFVGIAAVQIGLVEILKHINIVPDGFVGHSVGELGCAYADGSLTAEEMILAAYARGKASLEANLEPGMMAAVGLGYKAIKDRLPPSIQVACRNSADSCTLSGPVADVQAFVEQLKSETVFARTVNVAGIAYHSHCIAPAGPILLKYLKEIIKDPKPRSPKWISSSIPEADWNSPLAQMCSAEYHTNNLLSPVLFEEACKHIPANAICIEIAPHGLLQAILRRSLHTFNIPLTSKSATCSARYLLSAVGKMYLNNIHPDINALFPSVEYPVSRGTPGLAQFVSWDHREDWEFGRQYRIHLIPGEEEIDLMSMDQNRSELGHMIDNEVVIPVPALLIYIWKRLAVLRHETVLSSVVFEDIIVHTHVVVPHMAQVTINWLVQRASGKFEIRIVNGDSVTPVMSGKISPLDQQSKSENTLIDAELTKLEPVSVALSDFYPLIESKGYKLNDYYKAVKEIFISENECSGHIQWDNDWLPFLDSVFKVNIFLGMEESEGLLVPAFIRKLKIDTTAFSSLNSGCTVPFRKTYRSNITQCGGVELVGMELEKYSNPSPSHLKLEKLQFVPHIACGYEMNQFLSIVVQVVSESQLLLWKNKVINLIICEINDNTTDETAGLVQQLKNVITTQFNIESQVKVASHEELKFLYEQDHSTFYLVVSSCASLSDCVQQFDISDKVFFFTSSPGKIPLLDASIVPVLQHKIQNKNFVLFKKVVDVTNFNLVNDIEGSDWKVKLKYHMAKIENDKPIIVYWDYRAEISVSHVCKVLAKEDYAHRLHCFFILDKNAPTFSKNNPYYMKQLAQGLSVNVLSGGVWGSFRRLEISGVCQNFKEEVDVSTISLDGLDIKYFAINANSKKADDKDECELDHLEYAGVTENGEDVMGLAQFENLRNKINADSSLSWLVPQGWSLEDAVTVPSAYTTAYYALKLSTRLKSGESVLINAGYTTVGEAAISVAIDIGGDVFTTVLDESQAAALAKRFPKLKPNQILKLDESNFEVRLLRATKGEGVLVVVNPAGGADLQKSLKCLARYGRFVQLGKIEMLKREKIGMELFLGCRSIFGTENIFNAKPDWKTKLHAMFLDGIKRDVVKPFKRKVFYKNQSSIALKYLKKRNLQEKVVLAMKYIQQFNINNSRVPFKCDPNKSYLIVGSKYGLWLDFTEWLVVRGARKIVIAFEEESVCRFAASKFSVLITQYNSTIMMTSATFADTEKGTVDLLKKTIQLGPLAAIFNVLLDDDSVKVRNLDSASRMLVPELPHFVCLLGGSSAVCDARRRSGLPGLSIQCDLLLKKPVEVLSYLQHLLDNEDMGPGSQLVLVNDPHYFNKSSKVKSTSDEELLAYLPVKSELYDLGASLPSTPHFEQVTTLSPRRGFGRGSFTPLFLFPGINKTHLHGLIRKLFYPSYCLKLPAVWQIVQDIASDIVNEMIVIKPDGPYSIVSETWTGALSIEVGRLLEARGYTVNLILVDAAPAITQSWVSTMGHPSSPEFQDQLLFLLLNPSLEVRKHISQAKAWSEKIDCALISEKEEEKGGMEKALLSVHSNLRAVVNFKPSSPLFQGQVNLLRQNTASSSNFGQLFRCCAGNVKIHIIEDASSHAELIMSSVTARIINDNCLHSW